MCRSAGRRRRPAARLWRSSGNLTANSATIHLHFRRRLYDGRRLHPIKHHFPRKTMKTLARLVCAALIGSSVAFAPVSALAADPPKKNWTAPAYKIYGQKLVDDQMAKHKGL